MGDDVDGGQGNGTRARFLAPTPALDGVRALAVLGTFAVHLVPNAVPGGFVGVDVFFVLSGFLITSLLLGEHERTRQLDLRRFYVRRVRRLYPALLALLGVYVVWSTVRWRTHPWVIDMATAALNALYVANWAGVAGHAAPWEVDHLWSLNVEEQFYLVIPLVLLVLLRRGVDPRRAALVLGALALASAAADAASWALWHSVDVSYLATPLRSAGLLAGCALAFAHVHRLADPVLGRAGRSRLLPAACLAALLVLALTTHLTDASAYWVGIPAASACAVVLTGSLLLPQGGGSGGVRRFLRSAPAVAVGRRSYSLYLWQNPVQWGLTGPLHHVPLLAWLGANVAVTALLAEVSFRFVENLLHPARPATGSVGVPANP